ncbi:MAG: hypothetical protein IKT50_02550 [Clostridia bacterium]|nr:hypothetical protein [Clostridia bacterium]
MKKNYVAPSLEITKFETEDVLNESITTGLGDPTYSDKLTGSFGKNPINPT